MTDYRLRGAEALAKAVENEYTKGLQDYHLKPLNLLDKEGKPVGTVKADDGVIFCCRRGEREVELTDAFTDPDFKGFDRKKLSPLDFVILTMYNEKYTYLPIAFAPDKVQKTLAQVLSENGKTQFHLAESEKYAHVTFFFNGGNQKPFAGEEDCRIPSPKGIPFDQVPELSLPKVAERLCQAIDTGYDFIVTNYANGDVIGHTSNDDAKRKATTAVDKYVNIRKSRCQYGVPVSSAGLRIRVHSAKVEAGRRTGRPDFLHYLYELFSVVIVYPLHDRRIPEMKKRRIFYLFHREIVRTERIICSRIMQEYPVYSGDGKDDRI